MSFDKQEAAVLESIVPQLEAEGFEVYVRPSANLLPPFMQAHAPDAIARREDRNLAIEVLRKGAASQRKVDQFRELLSGHRDWDLRVYWVSPANTPEAIGPASRKEIERTIEDTEHLATQGLR